MPVGGLATDVKIAGRWGIVSGHDASNVMNGPETGHGLPTVQNGVAIRNNGAAARLPAADDRRDQGDHLRRHRQHAQRLRHVDQPVRVSLRRRRPRSVDARRRRARPSTSATTRPRRRSSRAAAPSSCSVRGNFAVRRADALRQGRGVQHRPEPGVTVGDPDRARLRVHRRHHAAGHHGVAGRPDRLRRQHADRGRLVPRRRRAAARSRGRASSRSASPAARRTRRGPSGGSSGPGGGGGGAAPAPSCSAPTRRSACAGSSRSRTPTMARSRAVIATGRAATTAASGTSAPTRIGGVKAVPQNKDLSDNWPEWFEGLNNNMTAYASACNGELIQAEKVTTLFPQASLTDRLAARDTFVQSATAANSAAIDRSELERRRQVDRLLQDGVRSDPVDAERDPAAAQPAGAVPVAEPRPRRSAAASSCSAPRSRPAAPAARAATTTVTRPSTACPTTRSRTTTSTSRASSARPRSTATARSQRLTADYFFIQGGPPSDEGSRQNISSRNTRHLRSFWDGVPRWLHHGFAHTVREILLPPDSPLLQPGERGFNFRTVRTDSTRRVAASFLGGPAIVLPTEVPIAVADSQRQPGRRRQGADPRQPRRADAGLGARRRLSRRAAPGRSARDQQPGAGHRRQQWRAPDQPGARRQPHPGHQGHARQDVAALAGRPGRA